MSRTQCRMPDRDLPRLEEGELGLEETQSAEVVLVPIPTWLTQAPHGRTVMVEAYAVEQCELCHREWPLKLSRPIE